VKVIGSIWFGKIGIVLIDNGFERKSYIGNGYGLNQSDDEQYISKMGNKFPLKEAESLILPL